jgi:RNA polymerase sigma-70 factor (ECF subfamily)
MTFSCDQSGVLSPLFLFFCKFLAVWRTNMVVMTEIPDKLSASPTHSDDADDARLVERFKCEDGSAFDRIVDEYAADVQVLAGRLLGWDGEVADVVQEVFLAAFLGLKRFKGASSLRTWLYSITINKCRSHRRRRLVRLRVFSGPNKDEVDSAESEPVMEYDLDRVRKAVRSLPVKYREVIVLKYLQELPTEKIREILGVSDNVIYVRLNRARAMLKDKLSNLMDG